jgi:hypothetical protein
MGTRTAHPLWRIATGWAYLHSKRPYGLLENDMSDVSKRVIDPVYAVVSPVAPRGAAATERALAPRLGSLSGRRVGFVWDYLFDGDSIFDVVRDEIERGRDNVSFVGFEEFGNIHGPDEDEVLERLPAALQASRVEAVAVGIGA